MVLIPIEVKRLVAEDGDGVGNITVQKKLVARAQQHQGFDFTGSPTVKERDCLARSTQPNQEWCAQERYILLRNRTISNRLSGIILFQNAILNHFIDRL